MPGPIKTAITQNSLTGDGKAFGKMGDLHTHAMDPNEMLDESGQKLRLEKKKLQFLDLKSDSPCCSKELLQDSKSHIKAIKSSINKYK